MEKNSLIQQTLQQAQELSKMVEQLSTTTNTVDNSTVVKNKLDNVSESKLKETVQSIIEESLKINDNPTQTQILEMGDMDYETSGDDLSIDMEDLDALPDLETDLTIGEPEMDYEDGTAIDARDLDTSELQKVFKRNPNVTVTVDDGNTVVNDTETGEEYIIMKEGQTQKKVKLEK